MFLLGHDIVAQNVFINVFLNFKGNSDIERYQMANKKIPFKYSRPVEEWLQEKGNFVSLHVCELSDYNNAGKACACDWQWEGTKCE